LNKSVLVIGGGASGMMAAGVAAKKGSKVILLEKNDRLGKKLLISGKGRCNITNATDIQGLIDNIPGNGNFLYSCFNTFSNMDLVDFFKSLGLDTKVERGNRIFPVSDQAGDVVNALKKFIRKNGVDVKLRSEANKVVHYEGNFIITLINGNITSANKLIIATGGVTYPVTGSTGDGYKFAKSLGHAINEPKPSLVPLIASSPWVPQLQGLSLKNVFVKLMINGKIVYSDFGEMMFTHFGLSGPVILSASRHLTGLAKNEEIKIVIDLKPALSQEQLDKRIQRDFERYSKKRYKNSLVDLLPQSVIPVIITLSNIDPEKPVNQISRNERYNLVALLKSLPVDIKCTRPISEGIVTSGGVSVNEINPHTMESKIVKGLFFTGEVIDVDGYTGGFNLQIAFSTGYVAGMNV